MSNVYLFPDAGTITQALRDASSDLQLDFYELDFFEAIGRRFAGKRLNDCRVSLQWQSEEIASKPQPYWDYLMSRPDLIEALKSCAVETYDEHFRAI